MDFINDLVQNYGSWLYLIGGISLMISGFLLIFQDWKRFRTHAERKVKLFPLIILHILWAITWIVLAANAGHYFIAGLLTALLVIQGYAFLNKYRIGRRAEL